MSAEKTTKTVLRLLLAWNDEKEGRWLAEQERSGWHLARVRCFGYTFERTAPSEMTYRLDFGPPVRGDRQEYFSLFKDAGWEHVGTRGLWQYFRKASGGGPVPEIHTDPHSRIAMYKRLIALAAMMLAMLITMTATNLNMKNSTFDRIPIVFGIYIFMMAVFSYSIVRLLLHIARLKRLKHETT